jgi:hypothetical protein
VWGLFVAVTAAALVALAAPDGARAAFEPRFEVAAGQPDPGRPEVAVAPNGDVHYVWRVQDGAEEVVRTRRRAADGTLGPVRTLSDAGGRVGGLPRLAVDDDGNVHFVWDWQPGSELSEVQTRRLSADGTLGPTRVLFDANEFEGGFDAHVAVDGDGNAYFSWVHQDIRLIGENFERIPDELETVRLSADGSLGAVQDIRVAHSINFGDMAVNANGDTAFVWIEMVSGTRGTFRGRRRSAAGTLGATHDLTGETGPNGIPDVAIDPQGNAHFVWAQFQNPVLDTRTRRLGADDALGATQVVSGASSTGSDPQVAVDAAGVAHFLWFSSSTARDIQLRRRAVDGTLGSTVTLGNGVFPKMALDPAGNGHVVWDTGGGSGFVTQARAFRADGTLGALQQLAPFSSRAEVAVNAEGFAAAAWSSGEGIEGAISGCLDSDDDALCDSWETEGIDPEGDGIIDVDLPGMGADPRHKDIFIEIDSMPGHVLSQAAIDVMVDAFADAPVPNPDGLTGITVHVDNGSGSTMNPVTGATWGSLSEATATLTHQAVIGSSGAGDVYNWSAFDAVKASNFDPNRALAFHYVISGHRYASTSSPNSSGISRNGPLDAFDLGGSDLLVTLGPASEPGEGSGTASQQAGTLMHELGHNLGLKHGGNDHVGYKPSYLSIMNYAFQMTGLRRADGTFQFDYSSVPVSMDETALDEDTGFGFDAASDQAQYFTAVLCPGAPRPPVGSLFVERLTAGPLDFNCDGMTGGQVAASVNGDVDLQAFESFLDWPALVFGGGRVGDVAGASAPLPAESPSIEPQLDELLANAEALQEDPRTSRPGPGPGGGGAGGSGGGAGGSGSSIPGAPNTALEALAFGARRIAVTRNGEVRVRLRNPNAVAVNGSLRLDMLAKLRRPAGGAAPRRVVLASRRFSIGPAARRVVTLRLSRADRRLLSRRKRLAVRARASMTAANGAKLTVTRNLTLSAPRRR